MQSCRRLQSLSLSVIHYTFEYRSIIFCMDGVHVRFPIVDVHVNLTHAFQEMYSCALQRTLWLAFQSKKFT